MSTMGEQELDKAAGGAKWVMTLAPVALALAVMALVSAFGLSEANDYDAAAGRVLAAFGAVLVAVGSVYRRPRLANVLLGAGAAVCLGCLGLWLPDARGREAKVVAGVLAFQAAATGGAFWCLRALRPPSTSLATTSSRRKRLVK